FLLYALPAMLFVVLLILFVGGLFYNFYAKYFPNLAGVLLALTLLRLFRKEVRAFVQGVRLVYLDKKELIMSRRARTYVLAGVAVLFLALAIPWAPWTLETDASLRPWTEIRLEASEEGTIVEIKAREGDPVQAGEVVAVLASQAAASGLAGAAAE